MNTNFGTCIYNSHVIDLDKVYRMLPADKKYAIATGNKTGKKVVDNKMYLNGVLVTDELLGIVKPEVQQEVQKPVVKEVQKPIVQEIQKPVVQVAQKPEVEQKFADKKLSEHLASMSNKGAVTIMPRSEEVSTVVLSLDLSHGIIITEESDIIIVDVNTGEKIEEEYNLNGNSCLVMPPSSNHAIDMKKVYITSDKAMYSYCLTVKDRITYKIVHKIGFNQPYVIDVNGFII